MTASLPASFWKRVRLLLLPFVAGLVLAPALFASDARRFQIPASSAEEALRAFSIQAGVEVLFSSDLAAGIRTNEVQGEYPPLKALEQLLSGTPLMARQKEKSGAFVVSRRAAPDPNAARAASRNDRPETPELADKKLELPVFEVMGSKLLNMDLPRSPDDPLPYVIFARERIEQSGAINLEDFLKQRLTMNAVEATNADSSTIFGTRSQVNLRGLGTGQTLILIDGHRTAGSSYGVATGPAQPDLNGIPLSAVERIEVLPATSSGIYGGGATGGVINVVLRRDYAGAEIKTTYDNTFDTDSAVRQVQFSGGVNLERGKTNILFNGAFSEANTLSLRDRDLVVRNRARILANNPANFLNATNPPLGATPNIRSVNGSPLFGNGTSYFTFVPPGYAGSSSLADVRTALQANAGRYNFDLANSAQALGGGGTPFFGVPETRSLMMTARRQFSHHFQAFLELSGSNSESEFPVSRLASYTIAASAPNNPFGQAVRVTVPGGAADSAVRSQNWERRLVAGALYKPGADWTLEADYTWSRSRTDTEEGPRLTGAESTPIGNGTINVFRDTQAYPLDFTGLLGFSAFTDPFRFTTEDMTLRAAGPLVRLPGGALHLSGLAERRDETIARTLEVSGTGVPRIYPSRSQAVDSAYLELRAPIVGQKNARPLLRQLELQLAGRWDWYKTESASTSTATEAAILRSNTQLESTNPTVALSFRPVEDLMVRGSYGTGFLPPTVYQLVSNPSALGINSNVIDLKRGNTAVSVPVVGSGGNPDLQPEESETTSLGVVLTPRAVRGLRFSLDYVRIEKENEIATPTEQERVIYEDFFPGIVTRGPVPPGDPYGVGPITAISTIVRNISKSKVEAYDASLDFRWETSIGSFEAFAQSTWTTHLVRQAHPRAVPVESAGKTAPGVPKLRATAGLVWQGGSWSAGWTARYIDSYRLTSATHILNQASDTVRSQTYHDAFASYRPRARPSALGRILRGTEFQIGVKNVFNTEPAFDLSAATQTTFSRFGSPRLASYWISVRKNFE